MTDTQDTEASTYWCVICGPVLKLHTDDPEANIIVHERRPHDFDLSYNDDEVMH